MPSRREIVVGLPALALASSLLLPVSRAVAQVDPLPAINPNAFYFLSQDDLDEVKQRLGGFFDRCARIAIDNPAPGANASNGYFVNGIKSDPELNIIMREFDFQSDGGKLMGIYAMQFMQRVRAGFEPGTHFATGLTYGVLARDVINAILPQIAGIVVSIIAAVYTEGGSEAAAESSDSKASIMDQINGLGDAVAAKGMVSSGEHANGWISVATRDRQNEMVDILNNKPVTFGGKTKQFLNILKAISKSYAQLPTDGHDPWLKANWQLGFTAVCLAGAKAMRGQIV